MSKRGIIVEEEKDAFIQIWKYLSANGRLFIPLENTIDTNAVYAEDYVEEKRKIIRAFMDTQAIELYILNVESDSQEFPPGTLKIGITPVKTLQKQLSEIYGKESKDGVQVECVLTSYDDRGNMQDVDTIWSHTNN